MSGREHRLSHEISPYLRQHADNPVDWYPWGDEAFAVARAEQRPVLLSIGYAACHWCHVMAHESFEDPSVADLMNRHFVNVKVDREERPDVDAVYMSAVQAMTGSGGWPLTVFLTPEGAPFYGGTYFPPTDRGGTPSFRRVLESLARAWGERRAEVEGSATEIRRYLEGLGRTFGADAGTSGAGVRLVDMALQALTGAEDEAGGFGDAPKFPPHAALQLLLGGGGSSRPGAAVARRALDAMAAGGIHDQLGGGFFRYSVDRHWRLPHFEKMLADNAQLLRAFALAHVHAVADERSGETTLDRDDDGSAGTDPYRRVVDGITTWLLRELATASGDADDEVAFYSALDADSEGEEGRFYSWQEAEFHRVIVDAERAAGASSSLRPDDVASLAARHYGVTTAGTFEGGNVLRIAVTAARLAESDGLDPHEVKDALDRAANSLLSHRATRVRPATDDKVVTSMNGLALAGLADAGRLLGDRRATRLAGKLARFLYRHVWRDGKLLHVWRQGEARVEGLLEDYAYVGLGLLAYYRASLEPWALTWAFELADACEERFADAESGGYFSTASDAEPLLVRPKAQTDGATPAESVAAAELVWWVARYRSGLDVQDAALRGLRPSDEAVRSAPQAFSSAVRLLDLAAAPGREVVIVAPEGSEELVEMVAAFRESDDGTAVILVVTGPEHPLARLPLLEGRVQRTTGPGGGSQDERPSQARAYVCEGGVCDLPVTDAAALSTLLRTR